MSIKSVAIIGGGPSGIASLYELTRVEISGQSLFGSKDISHLEQTNQLAFDKVVLFERNPSVGGAWSDSVTGKSVDPQLPPLQQLQSNLYNKPDEIYAKPALPHGAESASFNEPLLVDTEADSEDQVEKKYQYQWRGTGVYSGLFTNVPAKYMSFSFDEYDHQKIRQKYPKLQVLQPAEDVGAYLKKVTERNNLYKNIKLNTNVENVKKLDNGKWLVTVREKFAVNENNKDKFYDKWYSDTFDAVILANGKTIPHVPIFPHLAEFVERNASKPREQQALITHAKAVPDPKFLRKAKKVLFVGSSVSAADLLQYAFPRHGHGSPNSVFVSRKSESSVRTEWLDFACYSSGITTKPTIKQFLPDQNAIEFDDGTIEADFDVILFATGYHMHYPFLDQHQYPQQHQHHDVSNFYLFTFSRNDPTLALVGNTYAGFFFNRVESQAAALAGVWGGFSKLASPEEQEKWFANKKAQDLKVFFIRQNFIDPLIKLAVHGRPNPFDLGDRYEHVRDASEGKRLVEQIFFELKDGKYSPEDLFRLGWSGVEQQGDEFSFSDGFIDKLADLSVAEGYTDGRALRDSLQSSGSEFDSDKDARIRGSISSLSTDITKITEPSPGSQK